MLPYSVMKSINLSRSVKFGDKNAGESLDQIKCPGGSFITSMRIFSSRGILTLGQTLIQVLFFINEDTYL